MTTEEKRQKEAERKRLYRQRKAEEKARQAPQKELTEAFNLEARNVAPEMGKGLSLEAGSITPEIELSYRDAEVASDIRPLSPGHPLSRELERAAAEIHASAVESAMDGYRRDFSNANAMLRHILYHLVSIDISLSGRTAR